MFAALLDTSVLWPSLQRDFLLSMAIAGLYRPLWSEAILEELETHEARKLVARGAAPAVGAAKAAHLIERMRDAFDDALVLGWEPLDGTYGLPDRDDEHVVADAVVGGAGVIVTDNLRHFPTPAVPSHIEVQDARDFASSTASVDPACAAGALRAITERHRSPRREAPELLDLLVARYRMDELAEILRPTLKTRA